MGEFFIGRGPFFSKNKFFIGRGPFFSKKNVYQIDYLRVLLFSIIMVSVGIITLGGAF